MNEDDERVGRLRPFVVNKRMGDRGQSSLVSTAPEWPRVTVVVPSRSRPKILEGCLDALEAQSYPNQHLEIVVVDDGSEPALVLGRRAGVSLRLLRQESAGPAAARNLGARAATGEVVAFTDDDCRPTPEWLRHMVRRVAEDTLVGGRTVNGLPGQICSAASQHLFDFLDEWFRDRPGRFFASNNLAVGREAFLAAGGFDETFDRAAGEDREFGVRWSRLGGQLVDAPDATLLHAHELSLAGFLRQHFTYGCGAHTFHRQRSGHLRLEAPAFYVGLVLSPWGRERLLRALLQTGLLILSQGAVAAGFLWESLSTWRAQRGVLPQGGSVGARSADTRHRIPVDERPRAE